MPNPPSNFTQAGNQFAKKARGLRRGNFNNSNVRTLQSKLNARGYKLITDGDFGDKTRAALKSFQRSNNLNPSGILDFNTKSKLGLGSKGIHKSNFNPPRDFSAAAAQMLRNRAKSRR
jgi:peptidoglycan hydrolase-like protein with peptidoglycan-binding domain